MSDIATIAGLLRPGGSIRERRIELGWTRADLADRSGISQADISRIENGRLDARWSTIRRLSEALESSSTEPIRSLANAHRGRRSARPTGSRWTPQSTHSGQAGTIGLMSDAARADAQEV